MTNCLEIMTIQATAFKVLIEALKEMLTDTCIEFDESGMKIVAMDTAHIVLVHLKLDATKFEHYYCKSRMSIGVNMINFQKLIKTINSNDTLTLLMDENDPNHLGIRIENHDKNTRTTYKLNLLDIDNQDITIGPAEFNSVITMPSADFQKITRDMNNLAEYVEIRNVNKQLIFSCKGEFCAQETILSDNPSNSIKSNNANEIVQGVFSLRHLVMFTKCTNLCNTVELYLKNDYPLIIKYGVASLGEVKLCIAPSTNTA